MQILIQVLTHSSFTFNSSHTFIYIHDYPCFAFIPCFISFHHPGPFTLYPEPKLHDPDQSSTPVPVYSREQNHSHVLGVLVCAFNTYFDLMVKILEIFWHMLTHLSYMINKESRKSIGNFLRYNYFLPQVSFEQFCCWLLSCWDPHLIAEILSPRSIPYHSSNSIPTILRDSNTMLTKPLNSEHPLSPPTHYHHSPRTLNPPRTPITFLSSFVFIIPL